MNLVEHPADDCLDSVPREDLAGVVAAVRQRVQLGVEEHPDAATAQELDAPPERGLPGQVNVRIGYGDDRAARA
jgi:hypothetical protein